MVGIGFGVVVVVVVVVVVDVVVGAGLLVVEVDESTGLIASLLCRNDGAPRRL